MAMVSRWQRDTWTPIRDWRGVIVGWQEPAAGVDGPLSRPPLGPPRLGRRSTAGGRGNRRVCRGDVQLARWRAAHTAWLLRTTQGLTIREIAERVGVSRSVVGVWLRGCPAVGGGAAAVWWASMERDMAVLVEESRATDRALSCASSMG